MSNAARRAARIAAHHAAATAPSRWLCHVPGCHTRGRPQPADTDQAALAASAAHQATAHPPADAPANLEEERARWVAAGRPPLGEFPARFVAPQG